MEPLASLETPALNTRCGARGLIHLSPKPAIKRAKIRRRALAGRYHLRDRFGSPFSRDKLGKSVGCGGSIRFPSPAPCPPVLLGMPAAPHPPIPSAIFVLRSGLGLDRAFSWGLLAGLPVFDASDTVTACHLYAPAR